MRAKHVGFVAATPRGTGVEDDRAGAARRLSLLGALYAGSMALLLGMSFAAGAAGHIETSRLVPSARPVAAGAMLLGALVFLLARRRPSLRVPLAIVLQICGGAAFSVIETLKPWPPGGIVGIPIACLWIVLCAMLVQLRPRASLLTALATAASGPAFAGVAALAGWAPWVTPMTGTYYYTASFLAVIIAFVGSRALQQVKNEARLLGSYRLTAKIGQGGMGEVWRAEHHLLAHPAAVKLIRVDTIPAGDRKIILKRFEREAQITASLTSPHTVDLYDYGVSDDGIVYYTMELIDGLDLEHLIELHGPLAPARAAHFLRQACHSLAEAHAAGLIHRDIKPSNLFVCRAGLEQDYIKVLDFGLVRPVSHLEGFALTKKGIVMGTPGFIAPEVALGKPNVDHRSDLYSLGCVGYYLLSGEHVFDLGSPMRALHDHAYARPVELIAREPGLPPNLAQVVMRCLAKNPADRPADAEALAALLDGAVPRPWDQVEARRWWGELEKPKEARS